MGHADISWVWAVLYEHVNSRKLRFTAHFTALLPLVSPVALEKCTVSFWGHMLLSIILHDVLKDLRDIRKISFHSPSLNSIPPPVPAATCIHNHCVVVEAVTAARFSCMRHILFAAMQKRMAQRTLLCKSREKLQWGYTMGATSLQFCWRAGGGWVYL